MIVTMANDEKTEALLAETGARRSRHADGS
jgi:hypothetical protein